MRAATEEKEPQAGLSLWQQGAIFLVACAVIVSRRPDAVFLPQFCCEGGHFFYADAYNVGWWASMFHAYAGYFHAFPRLAAASALLVPLAKAPLVTNILHIFVQATPVGILLSARSSAWGGLRFRALMAAAYLALPNDMEITFGIAWSQWLLALSMILLLVASVPKGWFGRIFDCVFLLLSGLSGPFSILVLPVAAFLAWKRRGGWRWAQCALLAACSMMQLWALLILDPRGRPRYPIGFDAVVLARMLGCDVFVDALLGRIEVSVFPGAGGFIFLLCVAIGGVAIMIACFLKTHLEMRLFLVFTCLVLAASLLSPTAYAPPGTTMWEAMVKVPGIRYWFLPSLAFVWSLLWYVRSGTAILRSAACLLLCVMAFGVVMDWRNPAFDDLHFAEYARAFDAAPPGTVMIIPEYWRGWNIRLVKHASR